MFPNYLTLFLNPDYPIFFLFECIQSHLSISFLIPSPPSIPSSSLVFQRIQIKLFYCQFLNSSQFFLYISKPLNSTIKLLYLINYFIPIITTITILRRMLTIKDPRNFRHTLFCAIIAEQNIILEDINMRRNPPGLKPEQSTFLKMIQTISNGSKMIVTKGGTQMRFFAGMITNNQGVQFTFDCGNHRSIAYYLEYLILISMFGKNSLNVNLTGITNDNHDNSVDSIQQHLVPLLKQHYQFDNQLSIKIVKRGFLPEGGGLVHVTIPTARKLKKINLQQKGYIKRIRGICAGSKISTSILNQVKDQVKTAFLQFLPDIWIYTDYYKGDKASQSPGYSLSLKAETTTGSIITFDSAFQGEKTQIFTKQTVNKFLDQIKYSGVISTNYQWFLLTLMALSEKKTSSAKIGRVSPFTIQCLRVMRDFFGLTFEIQESKTDNMAVFRCLGIGYENYARVAY